MKRFGLLMVICFTFSKSKATDTLITRFINSIYTQEVNARAKYYYLLDSASNPKFDVHDVENIQLLKDSAINKIPFNDFIFKIQHDTSKLYWRNFNLIKARYDYLQNKQPYSYGPIILKYVPFDLSDSILTKLKKENVIPILVKPGMTKKQLNKVRKEAEDKYENEPFEEKDVFYFSKPIFSDDGQFVLIELSGSAHGCIDIFKLVKNKWIKVLLWRCWVC